MTRLELFRQQASEFNNLADTAVEAWFSTASIFLDSKIDSIPTVKQDLAIVLYAAHLCWLNKYPGSGGASRGPILNESDDKMGVKKQYALIQNSDTWFGQSFYGQSFNALIGSLKGPSILTRYGV